MGLYIIQKRKDQAGKTVIRKTVIRKIVNGNRAAADAAAFL